MRGNLFFVAMIGFCAGVAARTLVSFGWTFLFVGVFVCFLCLLLWLVTRRTLFAAVLLFLLVALLGGVRTAFVRTTLPGAFVPLVGKHVSLDGVIVAPPDIRETADRLTIEVTQGSEKTKVIVSVPLHPTYKIGEPVKVSGMFELPEPFDTDGGRTFAYDTFLAKDGIFALVQKANVTEATSSMESEGGGKGTKSAPRSDALFVVWGILIAFNDAIKHALELAIPEPYSSLAVGILIGGKQGLGQSLLDVFTITGLLQMVVLSGYNVTIVAEGILKALEPLPRKLAFLLAAIGVVLFVCMAGASSSAVRAGYMALLALTAKATGRAYAVVRALFLSLLLMLLWNPLLLLYDPGLQLSFAATLGLISGSPLLAKRMLWIKSPFVRDAVATTAAAQLAILPLLLYQSGNLSLVALPANLLTMPFVPLAMLLSAAAAIIGLVMTPLAPLAGLPAFSVLWYLIAIARLLAKLPFAQVIIPAFSFWIVIASYGVLTWIVMRLQKQTIQKIKGADLLPEGRKIPHLSSAKRRSR